MREVAERAEGRFLRNIGRKRGVSRQRVHQMWREAVRKGLVPKERWSRARRRTKRGEAPPPRRPLTDGSVLASFEDASRMAIGKSDYKTIVRAFQTSLVWEALRVSRTHAEAAQRLGLSPANFSIKFRALGMRKG